ncbi:MAG: PEP-CTERM sorting domain-containing protein [Proteobacteria bacterium]|nr:PEP-CTERM sorting domain-containing protein [Pseudomonadota bacterium]
MDRHLSKTLRIGALLACAIGTASTQAAPVTGTLYYTTYNGGQNVWSIDFSYDSSTHNYSLTNNTNIASTNGADGIIFGANGNLLIGGQSSGNVYELNRTTGALINTQNTGAPNYHLTLNPSGTSVYTSSFEGSLKTLSVPIGSGSTTTAVTGGDSGVTQIAFGLGGQVFYVNGNPNGHGNLGTIDLSTGFTNRLYTDVVPAHGLIFDPFTNLITMFGDGYTGTMNASNGSGLKVSNQQFTCDFDQGAVTGTGIALVAGCGRLTLLDYTLSNDITHPDYYQSIFVNDSIDDVAPLVGAGSCGTHCGTVPEPATLGLFGFGIAAILASRRRRVNTSPNPR